MSEIMTGRFVLYVTHPDEQGWLSVVPIPWWKGGGNRLVLVEETTECDLLTRKEADEYTEMYSLLEETSVRAYEVLFQPTSIGH